MTNKCKDVNIFVMDKSREIKNKRILIFICVLLTIIAIGLFYVYFIFQHRYKGRNIDNPWYISSQFGLENIKTVQKDKDKDFVILNLADLQTQDVESPRVKRIIESEVDYLIKKTNPNLITLTGDQVWSNHNLLSTIWLINMLDGYKIPYAPIFGNHDYGNTKNSSNADQNYCCDLYEKGKYSLFSRGPSNLGTLGNYVINVMEGTKIYKTIYMLDAGYEDKITDNQIAWVKWNADGIKSINGGEYTSAMCFMHKPLPEYKEAYEKYINGNDDVTSLGEVYVKYSLSGTIQNGFFDIAKQCNIVDIVCGHQHGNNFTLNYEGVRLTFALKTGQLGGYYNDGIANLNGATYFSMGSDVNIHNIYVKPNKFFITNEGNTFND